MPLLMVNFFLFFSFQAQLVVRLNIHNLQPLLSFQEFLYGTFHYGTQCVCSQQSFLILRKNSAFLVDFAITLFLHRYYNML